MNGRVYMYLRICKSKKYPKFQRQIWRQRTSPESGRKKECVLFSDLSVYLIYTCSVYIFITIYKGWLYQNNSDANAPQSLSNDCIIWKSIGYKILNKYYSYYY